MKRKLAILLASTLLFTGCGKEGANQSQDERTTDQLMARIGELEAENKKLKEANNTTEEPQTNEEPADEIVKEPEEDDVPREYKNALKSAENYISMMPMSEKGLLRQLTSEAGDKYPEEAAQYAIDNLEVDWNEQALKSAKQYLSMMPVSDEELRQQLVSDAGEGFTEEQAQYAIDNIE